MLHYFMSKNQLARGLTTIDAAALVVGTVIGTGIFLKTAVMSQLLGSSYYVLLAWVVAAVLSYAGALSYAELGSRFPRAGGEYAYLSEGYGRLTAFLYGWTRMWIAGPGSIAAYAAGAATFLGGAMAIPQGMGRSLTAIGFIVFFCALNCLAVRVSGRIQSLLTLTKLLLIGGIVAGVFAMGTESSAANFTSGPWPGLSAFGAALIAALWAFDGWNNLPMVGSEVKNAQRALPIALGLGMLAVALAYLLANAAFFYALPFETVTTGNSTLHPDALPVATMAANTFLGDWGIVTMSVIFTISALGAMHGSILTGARVPYAMAADGQMFKPLAFVHPSSRSPVTSVLFEGGIACVLALSGTFDQLTDAVVFSSWIFYGLGAGSLFIFRARDRRNGERPSFQAPGFPWVPAVFILVSIALLVNTIYVNPQPTLLGLAVIGLGVPAYFYFARRGVLPN